MKIIIEDNYIVIKVKPDYDYNINLDRLDTAEKILGWIAHLSEKSWFSEYFLERFLILVDSHNGIISESRVKT